jgi:hypothetical protein
VESRGDVVEETRTTRGIVFTACETQSSTTEVLGNKLAHTFSERYQVCGWRYKILLRDITSPTCSIRWFFLFAAVRKYIVSERRKCWCH